jgi:hypothetical protein
MGTFAMDSAGVLGRWSREYLHRLQQRSKWRGEDSWTPRIGELVIVKEDNLPPLDWNFGICEELFPGNDGITRVVTVKTSSGIYKTVGKALPCSCVNPGFLVILRVIGTHLYQGLPTLLLLPASSVSCSIVTDMVLCQDSLSEVQWCLLISFVLQDSLEEAFTTTNNNL